MTPKENTPKWSVLKVSTAKRPQISVLAVDTFRPQSSFHVARWSLSSMTIICVFKEI